MVEPYISFRGNAEKAIRFYAEVFKSKDLKMMHFSEMPPNPAHPITENNKNWIAYSQMTICGTKFSFSDIQTENQDRQEQKQELRQELVQELEHVQTQEKPEVTIAFTIRFDTTEKTQEVYHKLSKNAEILMELKSQFFAKAYAKLKDQFGIEWQLICE